MTIEHSSNEHLTDHFIKVYENNHWSYGSGEGSLLSNTLGYSKFLESFIKEKKITSIVDMGCGDFQFSQYIDLSSTQYHGFDIVPKVIKQNQIEYSQHNIQFSNYSGNPSELPKAELLIVKDVLQHLSNQFIFDFIPSMTRYKYCLITNCIAPHGISENHDSTQGRFRVLDLRLSPFNLHLDEVYSFTNPLSAEQKSIRWRKSVLLHEHIDS